MTLLDLFIANHFKFKKGRYLKTSILMDVKDEDVFSKELKDKILATGLVNPKNKTMLIGKTLVNLLPELLVYSGRKINPSNLKLLAKAFATNSIAAKYADYIDINKAISDAKKANDFKSLRGLEVIKKHI